MINNSSKILEDSLKTYKNTQESKVHNGMKKDLQEHTRYKME